MTREVIRHPGPPAAQPWEMVRGQSHSVQVTLRAGLTLLQAVAEVMDETGAEAGALILDGLALGPYRYVGPSPSFDGLHAAWYSPPRGGTQAEIAFGTAIIGRRGGAWWLHAHAVWEDGGRHCGHLLPDEVTIRQDTPLTLHAFTGGTFDVALNEETLFEIFHPKGGHSITPGNAVLAKVNPHKDISEAVQEIAQAAGFKQADVFGIGSLIGAGFETGPAMASPISEVLIPAGATAGETLHLPMHCVDPEDRQFSGDLLPGKGPVLVTFELLLIDKSA